MRAVIMPSCYVCGTRLTMGDPDTVCARCELVAHGQPRTSMLVYLLGRLRRVLGWR